MKSKKLQGHMAVMTANIIFGFGVPVTALLLKEWVSPMVYMLTRCVGAAAIFWLISLFLPSEHVERRDLVVICCGGLLGFVISQTLAAWALVFTSPVYFSIIASLTPVATMLMAALFIGERINFTRSIAVILATAGALLMIFTHWHGGTGRHDLLGISFGMLSLITWAIYLLITRQVSARYSAVTQMKWIFLASSIAVLPIAWGELDAVAGYVAIPFAMRYIRATSVSIYTNLQPIVASVVAILIHQDILTWDKPVALILVLLSAWLVTRTER